LAFTGIKSVTFGLLENDFDDDMGHEIYGWLYKQFVARTKSWHPLVMYNHIL
jgi:hypothetical protein